MKQIRTRIAPSPTGDPHVGTAYIALFNRCFAHSNGGKFILRVEDTDRVRSSKNSESNIIESLNWLGLTWDEGPDVGGEYGPYRQSERTKIYSEHADILLQNKKAFRCFCTSERLDQLRKHQLQEKTQVGYDGHCLNLSDEEIESRLKQGEDYVIRMKVPESGDCEFDDVLRESVSISWSQVDMQVLIKSDGMPTYHFANVVDDHLMNITHVIRGEEWINSVPKHLLLYEYLGWEPPIFCHMPLLRNPDKSKLSKRKNPTSIGYYEDMGYLPEALVNYLGMMGWTMPSGEEKFSIQEMTDNFDINRVSLGGPVFDLEKLNWLNGKYIREEMSDSEFIKKYTQWAFDSENIKNVIPLVRERVDKFSDVADLTSFFLSADVHLNEDSFSKIKLDRDKILRVLKFSLWRLEALESWDKESIHKEFQMLSGQMDLKFREFLSPLFVAVTGKYVSISVIESVTVLGIDIFRARTRDAIKILGGISKKMEKTLLSEYQNLFKSV